MRSHSDDDSVVTAQNEIDDDDPDDGVCKMLEAMEKLF
jgi:hypothetical protein